MIMLLFVLILPVCAKSQTVGIKTNLVSAAALTPNIGVEIGVGRRWTVDLPAGYNGWILDDGMRWKHWSVQPGVRYWFCDRFGGHFVGVHAHGGQYNFGGFDGRVRLPGWDDGLSPVATDLRALADTRVQGWFAGCGLSYGYAWVLGDHWNLEAELGVGYAYARGDRFACVECGRKTAEDAPHHYIGPTKASLNIVYLF